MAGKKILVADDSLTIQKVIKLALSNEGYEIKTVSDGNEAVQEISLFRPDVVLIDVSLPGKTAFEVKRAVHAGGIFSATKFILMSSAFEKVDEEQERESHFDGRLTKPFDPAHLRQLITNTIAGSPTADEPDFAEPLRPMAPAPVSMPQVENSSISLDLPPPWEITESSSSGSSDIRQLTESTIRMTGLDDIGWNVEESGTHQLPAFDSADSSEDEYSIDPEPIMAPLSTTASDSERPSFFESISRGEGAQAIPVPQVQMEELVRAQLQETLVQMAKEMLPDIAERLIKQEIRRMLSEQP